MLSTMRHAANSWVIKALLVFVALTFSVWGVGGYLDKQRAKPVAEVGRYGISPQEFNRAYDTNMKRLRQMTGGKMDKQTAELLGIKQQTLSNLVNRYLLLDFAHRLRLTVSPGTMSHHIAANQAFAINGRFDPNRYQMALKENHLTVREYESELVTELAMEQADMALTTLTALPPPILEESYLREQEKRMVTTYQIDPTALAPGFQPEEPALVDYLKQHQDQFMTQPKVKLRYVVLDSNSVRDGITIPPEEIKTYYEEHLAEYQLAEGRRARHILARIQDGKDEAAMTKIRQAQDRLKNGETFEKVATELSEDVTAQEGGDLGIFTRGMMVLPFEQAVFAMQVGQISEPVKSDFGYHLIKLEEIRQPHTSSLEETASEITAQLLEWKANDLVMNRSATLEDQLTATNDLAAIAKDLNLRYRETDFLSRDATNLEPLEKDPKFLDTAFATAKGETSHLLELSGNRFVTLEVLDRQEARPREIQEAKEEVTKAWQSEQARKTAEDILKITIQALREGKDQTEISATHPVVKIVKSPFFTALGKEADPSPAVRQVAFKLRMPQQVHNEILDSNQGLTVVRLEEIQPADPAGLKSEETKLRKSLEQAMGQDLYMAFITGLQQQTKVTVNQDVLERF